MAEGEDIDRILTTVWKDSRHRGINRRWRFINVFEADKKHHDITAYVHLHYSP